MNTRYRMWLLAAVLVALLGAIPALAYNHYTDELSGAAPTTPWPRPESAWSRRALMPSGSRPSPGSFLPTAMPTEERAWINSFSGL